jgi:outer membrane protein assembly factor BamD (BamD/ComL family)
MPGEPPLVVAPPAIEPRAANVAKAAERKNALAEEIRSIDLARGLLRKGDARGALAELDRYEALARRGGSMRSEATIVRIEALRASGDVKGATALGERFLAQHPKSPYVEYVRSMLTGP